MIRTQDSGLVMLLLERELLATKVAVPEMRHSVRDALGDGLWAAQLCVTELLNNVLTHLGEGTPVTVRVTLANDSRLRIEVTDPDPRALPVLRAAAESEESGRGLALVSALSLHWGVDQAPRSKTVWCDLGLDFE